MKLTQANIARLCMLPPTRTYIVSQTSSTQYVAFEDAADAVKAMWDKIFVEKGWIK